jgi:predicted transcriptional regulator
MDRILSARIDEVIYRKINDLSQRMHTSKKAVIEKAVDLLGKSFQEGNEIDVFKETSGTWKREETAEETVSRIRNEFNGSMNRYER